MVQNFVKLFFAVVSTFLVSCSGKDSLTELLETCSDSKALEAETVTESFPPSSYGITFSDSLLFSWSSSRGEDQLYMLNLKDMSSASYLKKGRGPFESTHVNALQIVGDTLYAEVETRKEEIFSYYIDKASSTLTKGTQQNKTGKLIKGERFLSFNRNIRDSLNSTMYEIQYRDERPPVFF